MINQYSIYIFLIFSIVAANLAWLSNKLFCIKAVAYKPGWLRWFEWLVWYTASFASGLILEYKTMGVLSEQDWEFYVVTLCLFVVFALPGFIYHYDLKNILKQR
ncbi:MAG TPA: DUF2818 family protein [Cycloclasticus sp.]|jgi:hypothetical protein|nr:DUF2818 family protein [Cycloclasticus sp.]HIL92597.1 DUF2818 family protein [Cycloclasticus sp.]